MVRSLTGSPLEAEDVSDILDFVSYEAKHQETFYLWRPRLRDPGDDWVLEVAFAAQADFLVTFDLKDFAETKSIGVNVITPQQLLLKIGR